MPVTIASCWENPSGSELVAKIQLDTKAVIGRVNAALRSPDSRSAFQLPSGRDFLADHGQPFVEKLVELLSSEVMIIELLRELFKRTPIDLVVMGGDNSHRQRAAIAVARQVGISTLNLAHATFAQTTQARYAGNQIALYADHVAVYGERSKTDMIALGYPRERIHVVGAPLWDHLYAESYQQSPSQARDHYDRPQKKTVLFCNGYAEAASAYYVYITARGIQMHHSLASAAKSLGTNTTFVFRPHPIELNRALMTPAGKAAQISRYESWLRSIGFVDPVVSTSSFEEDLCCSDVVVSANGSSTIPTAMILKRPVLVFRWSTGESKTYDERDGVVLADRDEDLVETLKQRIEFPRTAVGPQALANAALAGINHGNDGGAGRRLSELIFKLAGNETRTLSAV